MTEAEWLECIDSVRMQTYLGSNASQRKLRLFACGRWRQVRHLLTDEGGRPVIEIAERLADGRATASELDAVAFVEKWVAAGRKQGLRRAAAPLDSDGRHSRFYDTTLDVEIDGITDAGLTAALKIEPALIRDIFGNPFRPVTIVPAWQTSTVLALAQAAYDNRTLPAGTLDLVRLAILSDALEEAGCDDAAVLGHLRSPGPHVRGCWPLDLVLGKE